MERSTDDLMTEVLKAGSLALHLAADSPAGLMQALVSGWVLSHGDPTLHFFITTEHTLTPFSDAFDAGGKLAVRFVDSPDGPSIPLDAQDISRRLKKIDDSIGIDVALIAIKDLHVETLRRGRVFRPFSIVECIAPGSESGGATALDKLTIDGMYLVGWPISHQQTTSDGRGQFSISATPIMAPLRGVLTAPQAAEFLDDPSQARKYRNYSEIELRDAAGNEALDVKGMSGGPVVVVIGERIMVAGIQTGWFPRAKMISWQPLNLYVDAIVRIVCEYTRARH